MLAVERQMATLRLLLDAIGADLKTAYQRMGEAKMIVSVTEKLLRNGKVDGGAQ
jgi:hypothetical protein